MPRNGHALAATVIAIAMLFLAASNLATAVADPLPLATPPQKVLVLNSYHPEFLWTRQVMSGILDTFHQNKPDVFLAIEYMDWKNFPNVENLQSLRNLYQIRYSRQKIDLILATDNAAFDFALENREFLFSNAPIVFCGINDYAKIATNLPPRITGVVENIDPDDTLRTALTLHPGIKEVVVVVDGQTDAGKVRREEVAGVVPQFNDTLRFRFLDNTDLPQILKILHTLPDDRLVLFLIYNRDSTGRVYSDEEATRLITSASTVPVYHTWDWSLGLGTVGGHLLNGHVHGRQAADLAIRILDGEAPESIPVITRCECPPMFDYRVLQRFGVTRSSLPPGSVVINEPDPVRVKYRNRAGTAVGLAAIFLLLNVLLLINIKRRRRSEESLRHEQATLDSIFRAAPVGIGLVTDRIIRTANNRLCEMVGFTKDELVGQSSRILYPTEDEFQRVGTDKYNQIRERGTGTVETRWKRKDGIIIDVLLSSTPLNPSNWSHGVTFTALDITSRKQAEISLREERRLFVAGPVVVVKSRNTSEHPIDYISPNIHSQFGYPATEFTEGRIRFSDIIHPDDYSRLLREVEAYIDDGRLWYEQEYRIRNAAGKYRWINDFTMIIRDPAGAVTDFHGYIEDITERKTMQEERRKLEAQMQQSQKMESLGVLAGGIAHDFNNLLVAILGNIDLALQDVASLSPARDCLEDAEKASLRAADLCRQMLAYSGRGRFVVESIHLDELVNEMARMLEVSISKKVTLHLDFATDLPPVMADATQLRQVIMNLVINAAEAIGDQQGMVTLTTGIIECNRVALSNTLASEDIADGPCVFLDIADTGCGMDTETLSRIFDPFFSTKFTGRGLGLAAVLGIIRGHKGAINVSSEIGHGTTFRILLPVSEADPRSLKHKDPDLPWKGSGTILLVDDVESVRSLATRMLERMGFSVVCATDGREALRIYKEITTGNNPCRIQGVLLDLMMPHMDGEEAYRELRLLNPSLRVIMSSGYTELEISQRFEGRGLSGFIQKPYTYKNLTAALRRIVDQPAEEH